MSIGDRISTNIGTVLEVIERLIDVMSCTQVHKSRVRRIDRTDIVHTLDCGINSTRTAETPSRP